MSWTVATVPDLDPSPASLTAVVRNAPAGVNLVILPFLATTPDVATTMERALLRQAERPPSRTVALVSAAARARGINVAVSFYEIVGEGVRYSSVALVGSDGSILSTYRQAHAVNRPGQHEQLFFQPGMVGFPVTAVDGVRTGLLLGGDVWVPETARLLALGGSQLLILIAAPPAADRPLTITLARARAAENGRPVLVCMRNDGDLPGETLLVGADGLERRTEPADGWTLATLDPDDLAPANPATDPFRLRRPRLYGPLAHGDEVAPDETSRIADGPA